MKQTKFLGILCLILAFISIMVGASSFSWHKLLSGETNTWLLFLESRLPRTISIILAGSSMSIAGLLMQTVTQNHFAAPSTIGTVNAAKFGMLLSLFFFPTANLAQKMLFAFVSSIFFTIIFIRFLIFIKSFNLSTLSNIKCRFVYPFLNLLLFVIHNNLSYINLNTVIQLK